MGDAATLLTLAGTGAASVGIITAAGLQAWTGWLELKRVQLAAAPEDKIVRRARAGRSDLADLRERVRKLEAIASGVDY